MTREILPVIWSGPCTDECQLLENIYKVEYQSDYFYEQIPIFFFIFSSVVVFGSKFEYIFFLFVTFSLYQKISKMTRMFAHPNFYALIHINQVFSSSSSFCKKMQLYSMFVCIFRNHLKLKPFLSILFYYWRKIAISNNLYTTNITFFSF